MGKQSDAPTLRRYERATGVRKGSRLLLSISSAPYAAITANYALRLLVTQLDKLMTGLSWEEGVWSWDAYCFLLTPCPRMRSLLVQRERSRRQFGGMPHTKLQCLREAGANHATLLPVIQGIQMMQRARKQNQTLQTIASPRYSDGAS